MDHFSNAYDGRGQACIPGLIGNLETLRTQDEKVSFMENLGVGSCRHRAFLAFLVLEEMGVPVRYILSRTHAWVECEVGDATRGGAVRWVYVDLGGCPVDTLVPGDAGATEMTAYPGRGTGGDRIEYPSLAGQCQTLQLSDLPMDGHPLDGGPRLLGDRQRRQD
jgi:hypothetical protein